jgi:TolB-like protein
MKTALLGCALLLLHPPPLWAASDYEDSLRQLADSIRVEVVRAKKGRLGIIDFTDHNGESSPVGQFLAEELATQLQIGGELQIVDRKLLASTMKKHRVATLEPSIATKVRRVAKAVRTDVFVIGSYTETPDRVEVTAKLIASQTANAIAAVRGTIPKIGPLADLSKPSSAPPVNVEAIPTPPTPTELATQGAAPASDSSSAEGAPVPAQ